MKNNFIKNIMRKRIWFNIALITLLTLFTGLISLPDDTKANTFGESPSGILNFIKNQELNLGLDLQGGTKLRYRIEMSEVEEADRESIVSGIRGVIDRRVNRLGVSEPRITSSKLGDQYYINVELPGIDDINQAIDAVGKTVQLDFREEKLEYTEAELAEIKAHNSAQGEKANEVLAKVKENEDFSNLAQEYSEDAIEIIEKGGVLDPRFKDQLPADLQEKVFNLEVGTFYPELIEDDYGYYIYKVQNKEEVERETDTEEEMKFDYALIGYSEGMKDNESVTRTKEEAVALATEIALGASKETFASKIDENSDSNNRFVDFTTQSDLSAKLDDVNASNFASKLFAKNSGEIAGPFEGAKGYYVFNILEKKEANTIKKTETEITLARIVIKKKTEYPQNGWTSTGLTGAHFKNASVAIRQSTNEVYINIEFNEEGATLFKEITEKNLQKRIAIFLDDEPILDRGIDPLTGETQAYAPTVQSVITDGKAIIEGFYGEKAYREADELVTNLNTGAIPAPIILIGQQNIGASLGTNALAVGVKAGIIGLIILAIYMLIYYRLPGLMANLALIVYASVVIAIIRVTGITLTLAGIAGLILSIGMAVDANVLIFERMKEELRKGRSLSLSIQEGFNRAWLSIRDSNVSSLITCAILITFGTAIIKGFAVTLALGIICSMFSALIVTRSFLIVFVGTSIADKYFWWGIKESDIKDAMEIDTKMTRKERRRHNR